MVKGIGVDLIELSRIESNLEKHGEKFLEKILTPQEIFYCNKFHEKAPVVAGRFAAKEAIVKALGTGFGDSIEFHDITITNDSLGRPQVEFSERVKDKFKDPNILISITHCKSHAAAFAVWV